MKVLGLWNTLVGYVRSLFGRLLELRDTPHAIAGGVAIGIFFGFVPLFGLKTLLALGTAWLTRTSKLAAVITVSLHDTLTPLLPVLLRVEYDIGYWLLSHPHHFPPKLGTHHLHLGDLMKWTTFLHLELPLLVGSVFIALPCAAAGYAVTFWIVRSRRPGRLPAAA